MARVGQWRLAAAVLLAVSAGAAQAKDRHAARQDDRDGIYAVYVATSHGACAETYRWKIAVSGGQVRSAGFSFVRAFGRIDKQGIVSVAFRGFGQVANATGRLRKQSGMGHWSSPTIMQCSGSWRLPG